MVVAKVAYIWWVLQWLQGAVRMINERILSVLDREGSGWVDVGMFFVVLAPLCVGPTNKKKCLVFDVLKWHISPAREGIILYTDTKSYTSIYMPFIF
jgi:hypothetical protein